MTTVTASAPGKVVLCGEYAVLEGAPAISMAVDRRAVARVRRGGTGVVANGDTSERSRLSDIVATYVAPEAPQQCRFELDTRAFIDPASGSKLGIGSSAALTVALVAALSRLFAAGGESASGGFFAFAAHAALQHGAGSGVDIATALTGGIISYFAEDRKIKTLEWPEGIYHAVLWSGAAASTPKKLAGLRPGSASGKELVTGSSAVVDAWRGGDAAAIITALREYTETLRAFSDAHGLGVFGAGHDALTRSARSNSLVYKPCGAGGGDVGVALGTDPAEVAAFAKHSGFQPLDLRIDWHGVAVSGEAT